LEGNVAVLADSLCHESQDNGAASLAQMELMGR
jgi:hypothetical protein